MGARTARREQLFREKEIKTKGAAKRVADNDALMDTLTTDGKMVDAIFNEAQKSDPNIRLAFVEKTFLPRIKTAKGLAASNLTIPSVLTSSWRSADGRVAIVFVNLTRQPKDIKFEFDAVDYGFDPGTKLTVTRRTSVGTKPVTACMAQKLTMTDHLDSTQAIVLELSSKN